jgi:hypothetical protein
VAVGDYRIGALDSVRQAGSARRDAREEPEGAVDVQPGPVLAG